MAATSATIAAVCGGQGDGAAWLVSLASADERASSFSQAQTCADDDIARCAAVVKDGEADVYERGLAVLALGRTLGRELGSSQSRVSVAVGAFRQVCMYDRPLFSLSYTFINSNWTLELMPVHTRMCSIILLLYART